MSEISQRSEISLDTGPTSVLDQWLSTFFVLLRPFKLVRKPVHPCHCTKI